MTAKKKKAKSKRRSILKPNLSSLAGIRLMKRQMIEEARKKGWTEERIQQAIKG